MTSPRVLIVDDEADLRELLEITLVRMGLDVDSAESITSARRLLADRKYLVRDISAMASDTAVAVITAFGSAENAVAALKAGAFDYLSKPVALDQLRAMVRSALRLHEMPAVDSGGVSHGATTMRLIGQSQAIQDVRGRIARLARSMAPVAITGESGSGKELAARDIHGLSSRAGKAFIAVNCGAIPEALMEAEFFGYRNPAITGAAEDRDGFFQAAGGGTLLLDEVADLPLAMQVKLLRAIQERRVRKIGSTVEEPVDVRLISATHKNLLQCVESGSFRQDLYYRLNVIELQLPPLRERLDDIEILCQVILDRLCEGQQRVTVSPEALAAMQRYAFPGNVRELENVLERAMAFSSDGVIVADDLALRPTAVAVGKHEGIADDMAFEATAISQFPVLRQPDSHSENQDLPSSLPDHLDGVERDIICRALAKTRFNRTQAAELLGISFRQLRYRMQRLSIREPE